MIEMGRAGRGAVGGGGAGTVAFLRRDFRELWS